MVKYKFLLRKYFSDERHLKYSDKVKRKDLITYCGDYEKENIYQVKKQRSGAHKSQMWRKACDAWMKEEVENRPGVSTPVCQLYNAYIADNPYNYMDIGQFGKVLCSRFPNKKRRRGKQGAQIYVYQDVALKPRRTKTFPHALENDSLDLPDPPPPPLPGPSRSFNLLNQDECGPMSVPSMLVGNHKVGPILVSVPEDVYEKTLAKELEVCSELLVPSPISQTKRKSVDEGRSVSPVSNKKLKTAHEGHHQTSTDSEDHSTVMSPEVKGKMDVEEVKAEAVEVKKERRSITPPATLQPQQSPPHTLTPPQVHDENSDVKPKQHSKDSSTKKTPHSKDVKRPLQTKQRMALARQWVDANLVDKKGATTTAVAIAEAYVHDHPDEPLTQTSLSIVIRGKFPTRRKRLRQDNKTTYYYQDLELRRHRKYPVMIQVNTSQSVLSPTLLNINTVKEERKPEDKATTDVQHIIIGGKKKNSTNESPEEKVASIITKVSSPPLREDKMAASKDDEGRKQTIMIGMPKLNPTIVTDKDVGLPVAVYNPPAENVFEYGGVPCVMIPVNQTASNPSKVESEKFLPNSKAKQIAKMLSGTPQVLTRFNKPGVLSTPLPCQNVTYGKKTNSADRGLPVSQPYPSKIQIKPVPSVNDRLLPQASDEDKTMSLETSTERRKSQSPVSSMEKTKQDSPAGSEERRKSLLSGSLMDETIAKIKEEPLEPVDEANNEVPHLVADESQVAPSLPEQHLHDMDVLDYIKREMAEDDEYIFVATGIPGMSSDAVKISENQHVTFGDKVQGTENGTKVSECGEADIVNQTRELKDPATPKAAVIESAKPASVAENETNIVNTESFTNTLKSIVVQGSDKTSGKCDHQADCAKVDVNRVVTDKDTHDSGDSVEKCNKSIGLGSMEVEAARPNQKTSKVGKKSTQPARKIRSWDEDIRNFVAGKNDADIFESKNLEKRMRSRKKDGRLTNSFSNHKGLSKPTSKTQNGKSEPLPDKEDIMKEKEEIQFLDAKCGKKSESFDLDGQLRLLRMKRAVLNTAFELLSERSALLTETERARKLEAALFEDKPFICYEDQTGETNTSGDQLKGLPFHCTPSSTLEDLESCSQEQSTSLLLHHQACPGLGCMKCYTLRAAYIHITLFRHRCKVWYTFTKFVSKHSQGCNTAGCLMLFCQFMKHELHLCGVPILSNHLMEQRMLLEAEFMRCHKVGTHGADLHCSHHQDVRLPVPGITEVKVEARGLKLVADLVMPNSPATHDVTTPIMRTLQVAASHTQHYNSGQQ